MVDQLQIFAPTPEPSRAVNIPSTPSVATLTTDGCNSADPTREWEAGSIGSNFIGCRDYQRDACNNIHEELLKHRSTLMVMATGLGKTFTAATVVKNFRGRVLWLAHRDELLGQAVRELERLTGEEVSLEQAQSRGGGTRICVGSVATMRSARLKRWARDEFGLIVIDEAHHATASSYRAIVGHFACASILGMTATPDRSDKQGLHKLFDSVACKYDIQFGIDNGYLVPVDLIEVFVSSINLDRVKTVMGDLEQAGVEKEIIKAVAPISRAVIDASKNGERTLTFTPRVASAHAVAAALCAEKEGNAFAVDGKTDESERRSILKNHRAGVFQHLTNCLVFTEGYDDPGINIGCIARPTKSRSLYVQMLGRLLRPAPGIGELVEKMERHKAIAKSTKPRAIVIDITGHAGRHSLVSPVDILGLGYASDVQVLARKRLARTGGNVKEALEKAKEDIAKKLAENEARRLARVGQGAKDAEVTLSKRMLDPFSALGVDREPPVSQPNWAYDPISVGQIEQFKRNGLPVPPGCKKGDATRILMELARRRANGLCSYKMMKLLANPKFGGLDASNMSSAQANRLREYILRKGNGRFASITHTEALNVIKDGMR